MKCEMSDNARAYFHFLHDTLILLGSGARYAELVETPDVITQDDVDDLRRFNCKLIDFTKDKLVNLNKIAIGVQKGD